MEDKPTGQHEEQSSTTQAAQSPAPALSEKKEATQGDSEAYSQNEDTSDQIAPKTKWQRFKVWFSAITFADAVMLLLTGFIAMGTIVSAIAIGFQWHEMHEGGTQTNKIITADERMATAMETSTRQAQTAFEATTRQAEIAQRAWMTIEVHPTSTEHYQASKPFTVRFRAANVGHTPALSVKRVTYAIKVYKSEHPTFSIPGTFYAAKDLVYSGNLVPGGFLYSDITLQLSPTEVQDIIDDKIRIFIYGRIEYSDVFGTSHWNNFCDYLLSGGDIGICAQHNDMDNNQPKPN